MYHDLGEEKTDVVMDEVVTSRRCKWCKQVIFNHEDQANMICSVKQTRLENLRKELSKT